MRRSRPRFLWPQRAEQTISRFYSRADAIKVRQGFARTLTQRATLRPFFKTLLAQFDSDTVGDGGGVRVDVSISETVLSYAQRPLIEQEESTAKQLKGTTSGGTHKNAALLATYFADELQAANWSSTGWRGDGKGSRPERASA